MSKPYVEFSYCYLYASDIQASIKWYQKICGFQVLDVTPQYAVMETSPGQILNISTSKDSSRYFVINSYDISDIPPFRQHLLDHNIALEEDLPHWLVFKDPDLNKIGVWNNPGSMNLVDYQISDKVIHDTIRYYLDFKEESYFVIRSFADQSEFKVASEALIKECREIGVIQQGDAITISKFSDQVDVFYVGVPVAKVTIQNLPSGLEYIVIPAQEYSVYPIHKSKLEDLRTTQLVNRVQHSNTTLSRPEQFYILEHYIDDDYIEAYIPYVWNDTH